MPVDVRCLVGVQLVECLSEILLQLRGHNSVRLDNRIAGRIESMDKTRIFKVSSFLPQLLDALILVVSET